MHNYSDLLEQRTTLEAQKQLAFSNKESKEVIDELQQRIDELSILIRTYNFDESPTKLLSEPGNIVPKPKLLPISYEDFVEFYKNNIVESITEQLNAINVPIGVYAIFKNTVLESEDYIMKHHYNIYCSEIETRNNE